MSEFAAQHRLHLTAFGVGMHRAICQKWRGNGVNLASPAAEPFH